MTHQGWDVQLTAYAARDWLPGRDRPLHRGRLGVGADPVASGPAGGVGSVTKEIALAFGGLACSGVSR